MRRMSSSLDTRAPPTSNKCSLMFLVLASVDLDARAPDELVPLGEIGTNVRRELIGRARHHVVTEIRNALLHFGLIDDALHLLAHFRDDRPGRTGRQQPALERFGLELEARLDHRW